MSSSSRLKSMVPGWAVPGLRLARRIGFAVLEPLDWIVRVLNGKSDFPSLSLRRYVGPLRTFETSAGEFAGYLHVLAGLRPTERLLDIGCGCGALALVLRDQIAPEGQYVGVDISRPAIRWCQRRLASASPRLAFEHIDVHNAAYNPRASASAEAYRFPFDDQSFDVILLKSVFTHMRAGGVANYLAEIGRLLAPGGRCLATFFLLEAPPPVTSPGSVFRFAHGDGACFWEFAGSPETAVAHPREAILAALGRAGLELAHPAWPGTWSGNPGGAPFQDMMLLRRRSAA